MMHGADFKEPSIFAIVVGVDKYTDLPQLQKSAKDAMAVATFLRDELKATKVIELYNENATKDKLLKTITSLPSEEAFKPGGAMLFFFSGLAGRAPTEKPGSFIGTICPVDTNVRTNEEPEPRTGIPDSTLIKLFDQISRSHGNNITLLLDCDSDIFNWGNPNSCVVVTPEVAAETDSGGAFVRSLLNVLRAEKEAKRIRSLTVQSLAERIQVDNNDNRAVHCFGKSADRFLLDRARGGAYHSFIYGRREVGGTITLSAGVAQGIQCGTRLAFFFSDVKDTWNDKRGSLVVDSASATSAVLRSSDTSNETLPDIFYAAETQCPNETIQVTFEGEHPSSGPFQPKSFSWVKQVQDSANVTLKFECDSKSVTFFWNGLDSDKDRRGRYRISKLQIFEPRTRRMLRNAARLTYHLSRPSPTNALAKGLHIQLQKITDSGKQRKPSGEDLLQDGCMSKSLGKYETLGPYCLVLENRTGTDLWPYVFTFDPKNLNIIPWYLPPPGAGQSPLKAGDTLAVGCGDEEGLLFEDIITSAILYIRVFVTTEKTDFSFLRQEWKSPTEDRVRELESPVDHFVSSDPASADDDSQGKGFVTFGSTWAAKVVTIVLEMTDYLSMSSELDYD